MSRSKTSKRTLIAEERRNKAIEYRKAGASYQQIADILNTTPSNVHKMVCKSLELIRECTDENAQEVRALELERLDRLFLRHIGQQSSTRTPRQLIKPSGAWRDGPSSLDSTCPQSSHRPTAREEISRDGSTFRRWSCRSWNHIPR